jgi:hypothetical protein
MSGGWGLRGGAAILGVMLTVAVPARAQPVPEGEVYVFHSNPTDQCPGLDWHVITGINGTLSGIIAWNGMRSIARVHGKIALDRTFQLTATEMGGAGRRATVTGRVLPDGKLVANIKAPKVDCTGITVSLLRDAGGEQ